MQTNSDKSRCIEVGMKFIINHPTIDEPGVFTVDEINDTQFGKYITYSGGEIHETMCKFLE